ncbi:MAG TPA: hypothetical protein VJB87_04845 [Candidatus Nanoarchaeia archaeon]|nr:hypothetical protein [Candidatus Nanoarchaeia archaeon]
MNHKGEITNRTLLYLSILAIFITLFGATVSFVKLGKVELPLITGLAASSTATGTVNVTISNTISISLNTSFVDFGNGSLAAAPSYTPINTTAGTNPSTFNEPYGLVIRNDGNVDINLTINGSTAAQFLGGTTPSYMWNASDNESNSCGASGLNYSTKNITGNITAMSNTHTRVCSNLTFADATDEIIIEIYLNLSADTPAGRTYTDTAVQLRGEHFIG